jgi:hypothetical protein
MARFGFIGPVAKLGIGNDGKETHHNITHCERLRVESRMLMSDITNAPNEVSGAPSVYMILPLYSRQVDVAVAERFFRATSTKAVLWQHHCLSSLLAYGFNKALKQAIDEKHDWFLMLHGDVEPVQPDWVDILLAEAERVEADILSVVIPLKNRTGKTSTALGDPEDQFKRTHLTLSQISQLPETFCAGDTPRPHVPLLVNTGCMLLRLGRQWLNEAFFTINDRIEGEVLCEPEDWYFSRKAAEHGAKVYATSCVKAWHYGNMRFPNWIENA